MTGGRHRSPRLDAEYVIPLKWSTDEDAQEFAAYLRSIAGIVDITVVDGSDDVLFDRHDEQWAGLARHLRPEPWPGRNGKVAGVVTGMRHARHDTVVLADDDVRYGAAELDDAVDRFDRSGADVLRPQNYFAPLPWHARWDTARSLLNRVAGADHPGTYLLRRTTFLRMGGYDGDVLFENLQMVRSVLAAGGIEHRAPDLFVARRPPTATAFLGQRVRQAYDDFAQPGRLALELSVLPLLSAIAARRPGALAAAAGVVIAAAERGRRRHGGTRVFPCSAALWAPLWLAERSICIWLATVERARGGVHYRGARLKAAATRPAPRPPLSPAPDARTASRSGPTAAPRPMENAS